ncbi:hypothetical protein CXB51_008227 [Gossypium anomalum]|uniref:Uncharacterized protein n=1 Tax=Gossypium anomalum TaxID=47600 RepID=A0A8J5ZD02_9ROSI|nr:hypothetical protein CXB51_008227 [Gossypium anomalum]
MSVKGQKAEVGVNDMEGSVGFSDSKDFGFVGNESHSEGVGDEEIPGFNLNSAGLLGRPQVNKQINKLGIFLGDSLVLEFMNFVCVKFLRNYCFSL